MRKVISLKTRLLLSFWAMLLIALLVPAWYYYQSVRNEIVAEAQSSAIQRVQTVQWLLGQQSFHNSQDLQRWLVELGKQMGARITYMAQGGQIIADSVVPFAEIPKLDNHASRPEIVQARKQDLGLTIRFSRTLQKELIYAAKSVAGPGSLPSGVIRLAVPWSPVKERFDQISESFLVLGFAIFIPIALLSYLFTRQLDKPLRTMVSATEAIGQRNYRERLRFHPGHEFFALAQAINKMAEHIDSHIQTITEQKQQLEAVFNGMHEGVMVLDASGKIHGINRAMSDIIPKNSQAPGRRPLEVIMSLELQEACDRVLSSKSDLDTTHRSLQIVTDEERIYDVTIVKLRTEQHEAGAIVVFHDISELKRLEKVRQDFVANVSHELRTPLTSIKGYAETLLADTGQDSSTTHSFLQIILKNTNHMVKMVDDLLQLARLERQQKTVQLDRANATEALMAAWKACASLAEAKNIHLQSDLPEEGIYVKADFNQLLQVFRNLLENAIKYNPSGDSIAVFCRRQNRTVTFGVRDTGPGIPKQHQQRVFERFYRVEKHRSNYPGSTGLGLAICRHIIQNYDGRIWVQSPHESGNQGATFFFTLDYAQHSQEDPPSQAVSSAEG